MPAEEQPSADTSAVRGATRKNAGKTLRAISFTGAFGLVAVLGVLAAFRRDHGTLNDIYRAGDLLDTHEASELPLGAFYFAVAHLELLVLAALVVMCGAGVTRPARAMLIAFAGSFSIIYADSIAFWSAKIGGHLYVLPCDDALISMRYARNFAEGKGLVYNAGEAIDGYTNPLWTAVMIIPHALKLHEGVTSLPVILSGGALLLATALLARSLLASFDVVPALQWLAAVAVVYDASSFEHAVTGLETPLVGFSVMLVVWAYFRDQPRLLAVGLVTLTLTRADGLAVALLLLVWMVIERRATSELGFAAAMRASARWFAIALGVGFALLAWRYELYGHPLPNTYYLKVYPLTKRLWGGIANYGVRGLVMYGLPALYVIVNGSANARARAARRLLIADGAVWLYTMYLGGDVFAFMRFFGPMTCLLWTAVAMTASGDWAAKTRASRTTAFVIMAMAVPVKSEAGVIGRAWDHRDWIEQWLIAAKSVERNVPPDATVGTFFAGMPYFAPNHRFIDQLGKTESHIAHETEVHGVIPGHNKFDFPYIYSVRKPDVTFSALSCDEIERFTNLPRRVQLQRIEEIKKIPTFYMAPLEQAADPLFNSLYLPNRVVLRENGEPAGHTAGCWYVREGSSVPLVWELARY